ncbi:MAG: guanylate kinase [Leptolyngbyaceae cyanobacterium]
MNTGISKPGKLVVLTGPSGVGKGTLLKQLLEQHPELGLSISATTRSPRPNEIHGQHYFFVSPEEFTQMRDNGELLEWAEFAGNCYGTPKRPVEAKIAQGQSVVLEIELVGARQIRQAFPDALHVFILPPSLAELERRLRTRGHDSEASIASRLKRAAVEIKAASEFDIQVLNDDLNAALSKIEAALFTDAPMSPAVNPSMESLTV